MDAWSQILIDSSIEGTATRCPADYASGIGVPLGVQLPAHLPAPHNRHVIAAMLSKRPIHNRLVFGDFIVVV
jgi:hypothetical protein